MKTNRYLTDFYNNYDEDSRLTVKHGSVEFLTTMHYIGKYINPGDRCLKSAQGQADIPMRWHVKAILLMRWS